MSVSTALVDIAGVPTGVTITLTSGGTSNFFFDNASTTGDEELLMDDAFFPATSAPAVFTISGLAAGTYDVYTYAWAPDSAFYLSGVSVNGGVVTPVGGTWPGAYVIGITHALDTVTLAPGGSLVITISRLLTFSTFNGLQLVRSTISNTSFCDGGAVGTTCLGCGNNGSAGSGCANSSFTAGALLTSTGTPGVSDGTDTLVLSASNLTGMSVFFQATGVVAGPIAFGDGDLCAALGITRLGMSPGVPFASHPLGGAPKIHVTGGTLQAGDVRHYQCWYRDSAAFCTPAAFNLTQGLTVTWHH